MDEYENMRDPVNTVVLVSFGKYYAVKPYGTGDMSPN